MIFLILSDGWGPAQSLSGRGERVDFAFVHHTDLRGNDTQKRSAGGMRRCSI